jgi:hypothetical protein
MIEKAPTVPKKKEKPVDLFEGIEFIDTVIEHLEDLKTRICMDQEEQKAADQVEKGKVQRAAPPLAELLESGGTNIRNKCERLHTLINDLHATLF